MSKQRVSYEFVIGYFSKYEALWDGMLNVSGLDSVDLQDAFVENVDRRTFLDIAKSVDLLGTLKGKGVGFGDIMKFAKEDNYLLCNLLLKKEDVTKLLENGKSFQQIWDLGKKDEYLKFLDKIENKDTSPAEAKEGKMWGAEIQKKPESATTLKLTTTEKQKQRKDLNKSHSKD